MLRPEADCIKLVSRVLALAAERTLKHANVFRSIELDAGFEQLRLASEGMDWARLLRTLKTMEGGNDARRD